LIFDETPYKVYSAKVTGTATIKYIPFSEGETNRVYKGEGSIQFTCYTPFARSYKKFLNEYTIKDYPNRNEWADASGMRNKSHNGINYDTYSPATGQINLFNPGDLNAHFTLRLYFKDYENELIPAGSLNLNGKTLSWNNIPKQGADTYIIFDSKLNLICGAKGTEKDPKTGTVYN
jgi:hypothetical protein